MRQGCGGDCRPRRRRVQAQQVVVQANELGQDEAGKCKQQRRRRGGCTKCRARKGGFYPITQRMHRVKSDDDQADEGRSLTAVRLKSGVGRAAAWPTMAPLES
nr:hypothetical protein CFP56_43748 [Quercus suber]